MLPSSWLVKEAKLIEKNSWQLMTDAMDANGTEASLGRYSHSFFFSFFLVSQTAVSNRLYPPQLFKTDIFQLLRRNPQPIILTSVAWFHWVRVSICIYHSSWHVLLAFLTLLCSSCMLWHRCMLSFALCQIVRWIFPVLLSDVNSCHGQCQNGGTCKVRFICVWCRDRF